MIELKCIKFNDSLDVKGILWRDNYQKYSEYVKSHKWDKLFLVNALCSNAQNAKRLCGILQELLISDLCV